MAKSGSNRVLGLYVGPNQLEGPQDGAYVSLKNCVIKDKDVVEPREGVTRSLSSFSTDEERATTIAATASVSAGYIYQTHSDSKDSLKAAFTELATSCAAPTDWIRARFADSAGRCYATTDAGVKRIDSAGSVARAGGPEVFAGGGRDGRVNYDASGFLAVNNAVMYRAEVRRKAADGAWIIGPGSGRAVIRCQPNRTANAGGVVRTANVVTVTTTAAHGYKNLDRVNMLFDAADTGAGEFTNGTVIVQLVPSATSFTYSESAADYTSTAAATCRHGPGTTNITLRLDDYCIAGDTVRLYRSEAVTPVTAVPSEDVFLVWEGILTSTDITNGYLVIEDNTPEVLLGAPAYFSPSVEGDAGSNLAPARACDVAAVGSSLVLGNLRDPHQLEVRMIATGGSVGVIEGTTITFARGASNFVMTAAGQTNTLGAGEFGIHSGDTVAKDIERTAQSLVDGINAYTSNTFIDAYYVSDADDAPGILLFKARDFSTTAFTVVSTRGAAFAPQILNTGTATASSQTPAINQIAESKPGQPDAFPVSWRYGVGAANENVLRVLPVRDNKAIIIKERSVWLRSGVAPNIRLDLLDDALSFAFPNSAAVLDGVAYVMSSVGVVGISEGGVAYVGGPVSGLLDFLEPERLTNTGGTNLSATDGSNVWAAADTVLGCYLLFYSTEADALQSRTSLPPTSNCLVYSPVNRAWSGPWEVDWTAYARATTGTVIVGLPDVPTLATGNSLGADQRLFTHVNGKTVVTQPTATTLTFDDTSDLAVGDMLLYTHTVGPSSTTRRWVVTAISGTTVTLNVSHGSIFTPGSSQVTVAKGFECEAETVPLHKGGSGADAQVSDAVLLMDKEAFQSASVYVAGGDVGQEFKEAKELSRWGWGGTSISGQSVPYGDGKWGDYDGIRPERCSVPLDSQRAPFHSVRFSIREAGAKWRLHGIQLELQPGTVKGRK